MTPESLRRHAEAAVYIGSSRVTLVYPRGWKAPQGFPRGELLIANEDTGERVYSVDAKRLLKWIAKAEEPADERR